MKETNKIIGIDLGATNSLVAMGGDEEKNARRSVETTGGQNKHNATEDIIMETKKSKSNGEKTILEGTRNSTLYQMGIRSRVEESLSGNALRMKLLKINRERCELPLPENEVTRIAESVDKADVSDKTTNAHHGQPRKASNRKKGTEYFVSAATDPIPVEELLQKEVSYYPNCLTNKPTGITTIDECLETFWAGGKSETQILAIRDEPDKAKRNELKKGLHAIVFGSEPQEERKAAACKPNGIIVLDFDGIPSEELKSAKEAIAAIDYVFAVCLSVSGGGLFAFVAYEGEPNLKLLVAAMQADFPYPLDKSCSDLSRLRIVTFDENLILKEQVYPAMLREEVTTLETSAKMVSPTGHCIPVQRSIGVSALDAMLSQIEPVDWESFYPLDLMTSHSYRAKRTISCEVSNGYYSRRTKPTFRLSTLPESYISTQELTTSRSMNWNSKIS